MFPFKIRLYPLLVNAQEEYLVILKRLSELRKQILKSGERLSEWGKKVIPVLNLEQLKKGTETLGKVKSKWEGVGLAGDG